MAHKIAIIKEKAYYPGYGDDGYEMIVSSITDWTEVTNDEFNTLKKAGSHMGFTVLEQPIDTPKFVAKTVADYMKMVEEQTARDIAEKARRDEAALARKIKKAQKEKESKLDMLKRLQAELGVDS